MVHRLLSSGPVQSALAWLVAAYLAFALWTTRWTVQGWENIEPYARAEPAIIAFWHERLAPVTALLAHARRLIPGRRIVVLISRHRDGRLIARIVARFGAEAVHGSSDTKGRRKGGVPAQRRMAGILAGGALVVITPDGPRGPRRTAAAGLAQLAALTGRPVVACAAQTTRRLALPTWDRMVLPLPFGRGTLVCLPPLYVPRQGWTEALPAIEAALTAACEQADRACRS